MLRGTFLHHWLVTAAVADPVEAHAGSGLNLSVKFAVVWGAWIWSLWVQSHCRLSFLVAFFVVLEWLSLDCCWYSWIMSPVWDTDTQQPHTLARFSLILSHLSWVWSLRREVHQFSLKPWFSNSHQSLSQPLLSYGPGKKKTLSSFCLVLAKFKKNTYVVSSQNEEKKKKGAFQSHCSMEKSQFPSPFQIKSGQFLSQFQAGKRPFYEAESIHFLRQSWAREASVWVSSRGGTPGTSPSLGVLLSQQLFGDAIPIKLHYGVPLSINFSALQCPQQSLI